MAKLFDIAKNLFWLLIIMQVVPPLIKSVAYHYSSLWQLKTKVGLLSIKGTLQDSTTAIKQLQQLFQDNSIKAILIKIDSPGGSAGTCQALFNEINELKKNIHPKYVVALIENCATSGAYYIACAADSIIASSCALIGGIGSSISVWSVKEFMEQHHIHYELIKSGAHKGVGNLFLPINEQDKDMLQKVTNSSNEQFIKDVISSRPKAKLASNEAVWAQGALFTGNQAVALGLIDKVGSQSTAQEILKEYAPIVGMIEWIEPTSPLSFSSLFHGREASFFTDLTTSILPSLHGSTVLNT